ncbi:hypothetical protein RBY4I_1389 [Rhodobacterales bacterium Y4I]|nr:hypothetical protein RBY4I_1389 [Rhodobacterales bacterium Y4I]
MVEWLPRLDPNYGRRIKSLLRIYWQALLAGHIQAHDKDNTILRVAPRAREMQRERGVGE